MTAAAVSQNPASKVPQSLNTDAWERVLALTRLTRSLRTPPMTFDQFLEISRLFPEFRMEQEKNGQITIMPPVFSGSGNRENKISYQ